MEGEEGEGGEGERGERRERRERGCMWRTGYIVATRLTICKEPEIAIVDNRMISFVESLPQALCKIFH